MKDAQRMQAFQVRISDDVIIRRCGTLTINAVDSLAAIEIARRRAVMGEIDMRDEDAETYTPFSFEIVRQTPETRHPVMKSGNEERTMDGGLRKRE